MMGKLPSSADILCHDRAYPISETRQPHKALAQERDRNICIANGFSELRSPRGGSDTPRLNIKGGGLPNHRSQNVLSVKYELRAQKIRRKELMA